MAAKPKNHDALKTDAALAARCREQTVELIPFIKFLAIHSRMPLPLDDLVQEGALAVFTALPRWDPARGCKLESWLARRILGAFQDYARRTGKLTRGGGRSRVEHWLSLNRRVGVDDTGRPMTFADALPAPEEAAQPMDLDDWMPLLRNLTAREKSIVLERFFHGRTQGQIAAMLGIGESRVSQLLDEILTKLVQLDHEDHRLRKLAS